MDKENQVNQLPSSPYTPTQKALKVSTPKKSATKPKASVGSRLALQETSARKEDGSKQQIDVLKKKLANKSRALRESVEAQRETAEALHEAKSTIDLNEKEISFLRAKLAHFAHLEQVSSAQPLYTLPARYRDISLGFSVAALPFEDVEDHTLRCEEEMLAAPACATAPLAPYHKDLALGFSVAALSIDF